MPKRNEKTGKKFSWMYFLAGGLLVYFGLNIFGDPLVPHRGLPVDVRPFQLPMAIMSTGIGLFFLWTAFSPRKINDHSLWICEKCEKTMKHSLLVDDKCPDCSVLMEPLEGFYMRHPESGDQQQTEKEDN